MNTVCRQFCHQHIALELWFSRGFSLFIVFENNEIRKKFSDWLMSKEYFPKSTSLYGPSFSHKICQIAKGKININQITLDWQNGILSSFIYLLCLNFLSDRSFSNFCQYPIMPWLINRDLSKPMGQQDEERAKSFLDTFETSSPDLHFYGSHYSSPAIIIHFLLRIQPFSNLHLELHNGFDHKDRLFYSIQNEWESSSSKSNHNVEELIPEIFQIPEIFININKLPLFTNSKNENIQDVIIPSQFKSIIDFIWNIRNKLEESNNLEKWIDLIFGFNSRGQNAINYKNLFYPTTYGIKSILSSDEKAFDTMMRCFGQTPTQIFKENHPSRSTVFSQRKPILLESKNIYYQKVTTDYFYSKDSIIFSKNGFYYVDSCFNEFSRLTNNLILNYFDGLFNWKNFSINFISTSSFSNEKLLYCVVYQTGLIQIYRSQCEKNGNIIGYYPLSSCSLPLEISTFDITTFNSCAISSHHYVVCESSNNLLFCFHVGTGKFIRYIQCKGLINSIQIDDSFCCYYIFSNNFIEVFTLNGTFVANVECDSPIISSSISYNDILVFTSTCHQDNTIRLWSIDSNLSILICKQIIQSPINNILKIQILKSGSSLICLSSNKKGIIFSTNGVGIGLIKQNTVLSCAKCGKSNSINTFVECQSCGLFYCSQCKRDNGGTICLQCLEFIEEIADIIDDF